MPNEEHCTLPTTGRKSHCLKEAPWQVAMAVTKPVVASAVRNFLWTLAISIQKNMVADPMPAMPKERALYTADHCPQVTPFGRGAIAGE